MQPQQGSRINLGELKAQIVKKLGAERSKRYFYNLSRFLSQKLSKIEFDKSCYRILGKENLPLHNQLIRSILKNACQAKTPPPVHGAVPAKSLIQIEREGLVRATEKPGVPSKDQNEGAIFEDGEEVEQVNHINLSRSPLLAPLGIPFFSASVGGARKAIPVASSGDFISYCDSGGLFNTETLKKRMEQIAVAQGLGGVSMECASMLNNMLDVYLKKLIGSCVDLVRSRSTHELRKHSTHKPQPQGKLVNGMWPSNQLHMQSSSGPTEVLQEQGQWCSISLLDFKVAMELNPHQLGEDWPLLLEKICMHSFEE